MAKLIVYIKIWVLAHFKIQKFSSRQIKLSGKFTSLEYMLFVFVFTDNYLPDILYHGLHGSFSILSDVWGSDYGTRQAALCSSKKEELKLNRYWNSLCTTILKLIFAQKFAKHHTCQMFSKPSIYLSLFKGFWFS